jgi:SAM-dependent methyltransferase
MPTESYIPALGHAWLTKVYDPVLAVLFPERLFRLPLITVLNLQPGQHILDIGCGTATVSLLLRNCAPDLCVVGLDIDPEVLTIAQRKVAQSGAQLPLSWASADRLPYANDSFDHVLSSLMFHHLNTAQKGCMLAEAWRVLRPNNMLWILDFGPPRSSWLAAVLTTLAAGFEHIDDNLHGRVPSLLSQAGFADVQVRDIAFGGLIKLYQGRKPVG